MHPPCSPSEGNPLADQIEVTPEEELSQNLQQEIVKEIEFGVSELGDRTHVGSLRYTGTT